MSSGRNGVSRRMFARAAATTVGALGLPLGISLGTSSVLDAAAVGTQGAAAQQGGGAPTGAQGGGRGGMPAAATALDNSNVTLQFEFLMDLLLDTSPAQNLGSRQIVPVTGGTFTGPRLRGTSLGTGGDWIVRRADGASQLNVRTTLRTDDDQLIYVTYNGILYTPPGPPPGPLYWRTTPVFETASPKYEWLTRIVAVGVGMRVPGKAAYRIFQIL